MTFAATLNSDVKHLGNHTDSVAIYLSEGGPREVARDVVISFEVVALITIFSKHLYFYLVSLICTV